MSNCTKKVWNQSHFIRALLICPPIFPRWQPSIGYPQSPPYGRVGTSIVYGSLKADWVTPVTWAIAAIMDPRKHLAPFWTCNLKMVFCCAFGCSNRCEDGYKMYRIPSGDRNVERRKKWLCAIKRDDFNPKAARLCEATNISLF